MLMNICVEGTQVNIKSSFLLYDVQVCNYWSCGIYMFFFFFSSVPVPFHTQQSMSYPVFHECLVLSLFFILVILRCV